MTSGSACPARRRRPRSLLIALAVAVAGGCGGSGSRSGSGSGSGVASSSSSTTPGSARQLAADTALANRVVLQLADLPAGYRPLPRQPKARTKASAAQDQLLACVHLSPVTRRPGRVSVRGKVFEQPLSPSRILEVTSDVIIEPTTADLARRFSALTNASGATCLEHYLRASFAAEPSLSKLAPTGLTMRSIPMDPVGDQRAAIEGSVTFSVASQSIPATFDFYFVRVGRTVEMLATIGLNASFPGTVTGRLLRTLVGRVQPVA